MNALVDKTADIHIDAAAVLGALTAFMIAIGGIATYFLNRKSRRLNDKKNEIETQALAIQISDSVLKQVHQEWNADKLQWTAERIELQTQLASLQEKASSTSSRLDKIEEIERMNLITGAKHKIWDDLAYAKLKEVDPHFPPPPPVRVEYDGRDAYSLIQRDTDSQLRLEYEGDKE